MNSTLRKTFKIIVVIAFLELFLRCGGAVFIIVHNVINEIKLFDRTTSGQRLDDQQALRIVCVGDSETGWGQYPQKLEKYLNQIQNKQRYVVFNEGIPAATTKRLLSQLPEIVSNYKPDIMVVMIGAEDQLLINKGKGAVEKHPFSRVFEVSRDFVLKLVHDSQNILNVPRATEKKPEGLLAKDVKLDGEYQGVQDYLASQNILMVACQYPMMDMALLKNKFVPKKNTLFVDNQKIFIDAGARENYYGFFFDHMLGDFGHLNSRGEDLFSKNVAQTILSATMSKSSEQTKF